MGTHEQAKLQGLFFFRENYKGYNRTGGDIMNKILTALYVALFIAGLAMVKMDGNGDLLSIVIFIGIMNYSTRKESRKS